MKMVDDWRRAWRWASVQASALGALLIAIGEMAQQGWLGLPADIRAMIPHGDTIALVLFVAIPVLRIISFKGKDHGE